ncbi:hypothetical protein [Rubinisphaera italica]|uniref:Uncharacterized protein n=1 Tax=Rubinisphaera italica TaxID=2527969 RepID=A0A5C5XMG7_9PLAN|nr:hypothetical protein [Rubinisphaera italica]TWT64396.1 hypothetical protein Pan54_51580 [Rubinisphaera italica]
MMTLYVAHPPDYSLPFTPPASWVTAVENEFAIVFKDFLAMRRMIESLTHRVLQFQPTLVPFFATGGIPYVLPIIQSLKGPEAAPLIDRPRFHRFPGLSWNGKHDGETSTEFFEREFAALITAELEYTDTIRIWTVDATFTGNAINRLLKAIYGAFSRLKEQPKQAVVSVVGIIDASRAHRNDEDGILILPTEYGDLNVAAPSEFRPAVDLVDGQPCRFERSEGDTLFDLEVTYWSAPSIPTEDRAELIGAHSQKDKLGVYSESVRGRITIEFENQMSSSGTGGDTVASNILNWLAKPEESPPWRDWLRTADAPEVENYEDYNEAKRQGQTGLSIAEAMFSSTDDLVRGYLEKDGLLNDDEIQNLWDRALNEFQGNGAQQSVRWPNNLLRKVSASVRQYPEIADRAFKLLQVCFLEFAAIEPVDEDFETRLQWWKDKIPRDQTGSS